jgi:signal transduction histidine kinase
MRIMPRSLFGRLLGIAALTTVAALAFAAFSISHVLERFVIHGLDQQLDAQIGILAKAVRPDGTLDQSRVIDLPAFDEAGSEWSWRVDGAGGQHWTRGAVLDALALSAPSFRPDRPDQERRAIEPEPQPGDGRGPSGEPIHFRQFAVQTGGGMVMITASGPRRVALAPLREAMVPLLGSLALLGAGLALATLVQLRLGLSPLRTLQAELAAVRAGRARHIPLDQPAEIEPLAVELNALIDQNEAGLEHARRHVSNLAHGLKTPLAALSIKLAERGRDPDGSLGEMVAQIDSRVRHHLGRARAAAPGGSHRACTTLAPAVDDLIHALGRIHAERAISVTTTIASALAVAVDPQDLDEMVGNLLDNAWRYARSAVAISAQQAGATVMLTIDDDGSGLSEAAISEALVPGRRLDERSDGHGFGLSIAVELAELSGGSLTLRRSPAMSGLRTILKLPVAIIRDLD